MTAKNVARLASDGQLGQDFYFEGYCVSAAIDATFDTQNVRVAVYEANYAAVVEGEIGNEGSATDTFYQLLGALVFRDVHAENFMAQPYQFTSLEELRGDLAELRGHSTILLDVNEGLHSVGLRPAGDDPDEWQIVGTHQIVAVASEGEPLDIQGMITPKVITTEQVWDYLVENNSPESTEQTALIFPPEPS